MHPDKWPEIKEKILKNFAVLDQRLEENKETRETKEIIEFNGPLGKMKLEWLTKPKVLDKKTHYSNRIGGEVTVDYVYSPSETVHTLKVYRWDQLNSDWTELEADKFI